MTSAKWPVLLLTVAAVISLAAGPPAREPASDQASEPARLPPPSHGIEPEADRLLRAMASYLASLQSFTVLAAVTDEVVLASGQKIQRASETLMSVQRPNRLRSEQVGATGELTFWYDGKQTTLACKADDRYATLPAPASIDATIDRIRKQFRIDAPGADFLYSRPYEILTEQVTGGRLVGRETVDTVATTHLAFEGEAVDWQIWIQEGSQPLPLRFVVTTKGVRGQPQFTVRWSRWDPGIKVPPTTFAYEAPPAARRLGSFPRDCLPTPTPTPTPAPAGRATTSAVQPPAPPEYAGVARRSVRRTAY
jgi:hypothetical protein